MTDAVTLAIIRELTARLRAVEETHPYVGGVRASTLREAIDVILTETAKATGGQT